MFFGGLPTTPWQLSLAQQSNSRCLTCTVFLHLLPVTHKNNHNVVYIPLATSEIRMMYKQGIDETTIHQAPNVQCTIPVSNSRRILNTHNYPSRHFLCSKVARNINALGIRLRYLKVLTWEPEFHTYLAIESCGIMAVPENI